MHSSGTALHALAGLQFLDTGAEVCWPWPAVAATAALAAVAVMKPVHV